jgi:hypothetical protein
MVYNIRLTNSILGWMLVPSYQRPTAGIEAVLSHLYGEDWLKMKSSDRAFMKGEPVEKVIEHIKSVCRDLKLSVSICGNRNLPTLRVWWNPVVTVEPEKVTVDLKWSCWSEDRGYWDEYAPGVWDRMERAFKGEAGPVVVGTGPRKEIRYGSVLIEKGEASGWFATEWDEVHELADTLGTECDDAFCEMIPHTMELMEPGVAWDFRVRARKFPNLMRRIDNEENELLQHDKREWESIEACFRQSGDR